MLSFHRETGIFHEVRRDVISARSEHNLRVEEQIYGIFLKATYAQYQIPVRLVARVDNSDTSVTIYYKNIS
jgi:hypothetical protein